MELRIHTLGSNTSQQNSTKSLLTTINSGYDSKQTVTNFCKTCSEENSILDSLNTGFVNSYKPYPEHDEKPVIQVETSHIHTNEDSIIDSVETGFDKENTLTVQCPEFKTFVALYKENYLGEFKTESEKELARQNLDVYGKSEISKIVSDVINNDGLNNVIKQEVQEAVQDLDFVNSTSRSYVNYEIPNNLFKI